MTEPNFRALCVELIKAVKGECSRNHKYELVSRALNALATPPPEPLRPIPVSERLPEAKDCLGRPTESYDAGWCWCYTCELWLFRAVIFPMPPLDQPRVLLPQGTTHWLPYNAIPFPGENP